MVQTKKLLILVFLFLYVFTDDGYRDSCKNANERLDRLYYFDNMGRKIRMISKYDVVKGKKLGNGCFGTVYEAYYERYNYSTYNYDLEPVVIKVQILQKSSYDYKVNIEDIDKETKNLADTLNNPQQANTYMKYYGCFYYEDEDYKQTEIYLIVERLLDTLENKRNEFKNALHMKDRFIHYIKLLNDIYKFREEKKIHNDIKPDNIMVTMTNPVSLKFVDYGLMKNIQTKINKIYLYYAPPTYFRQLQSMASTFYDVYALMLTIANIEYGNKFIFTYGHKDIHNNNNINCYRLPVPEMENGKIKRYIYRYSDDCIEYLKKNLGKGSFCQKERRIKTDIMIDCYSEYQDIDKEDQLLQKYIEESKNKTVCDDFYCIILKYMFYNFYKTPQHNQEKYDGILKDMNSLQQSFLRNVIIL